MRVKSSKKTPTSIKHIESSPYLKLRRMAKSLMLHEKQCTLSATSLVHELFLKLQRKEPSVQFDSGEIPSFASRIMKQILIDRARTRLARQKAENLSMPARRISDSETHRLRTRLVELDDTISLLGQSLPLNAE